MIVLSAPTIASPRGLTVEEGGDDAVSNWDRRSKAADTVRHTCWQCPGFFASRTAWRGFSALAGCQGAVSSQALPEPVRVAAYPV